MIADGHDVPQERQGATLAEETEGFLLLEAERQRARQGAEDLCARLPWLTTAQAEDLTHHYIQRDLALTHQRLRSTADRAARLRQEYEARYVTLKRTLLRRHATCAACLVAAASAAGAVMCLLAR
ncbi:hypothetical protein [Streptomyces sp. NPDC003006]